MLIVAITGRSGSGKSLISAHYKSLGFPLMDCDEVSREISYPNSLYVKQLVNAFGNSIVDNNGSLQRKKLAEIAFKDNETTKKLNDITHPLILKEFFIQREEAEAKHSKIFFVDGAAIIDGIFKDYCDKIILVTAQHKLAVSRIILRDGISKTAATSRLARQQHEDEMISYADYIIENNSTPISACQQADIILKELCAVEN